MAKKPKNLSDFPDPLDWYDGPKSNLETQKDCSFIIAMLACGGFIAVLLIVLAFSPVMR